MYENGYETRYRTSRTPLTEDKENTIKKKIYTETKETEHIVYRSPEAHNDCKCSSGLKRPWSVKDSCLEQLAKREEELRKLTEKYISLKSKNGLIKCLMTLKSKKTLL
jgi:hypothetical protein